MGENTINIIRGCLFVVYWVQCLELDHRKDGHHPDGPEKLRSFSNKTNVLDKQTRVLG